MKSYRPWLLLVALSVLASAGLSLWMVRKIERNGLRNLQDSMTTAGWALASRGEAPAAELQQLAEQAAQASGSRVRILDARGEVVADSTGDKEPQSQVRFRPEVEQAMGGQPAAWTRFSDETDRSLALFVAVPAAGGGVIYLSHTTDDILQELGVARRQVVDFLFGLTVALFLASFYLSGHLRSTLRRLQRLTASPTELIPVEGSDEVAHIGESFNRLVTSLQAKVSELEEERAKTRQFVEDIAHELKTPITVLCGSLETLASCPDEQPRLLGNLGEEVQRLSRLVARLLDLQKLDYYELRPEPFDLVSLVETVVEKAELEAKRKSIRLTLEAPDEATVTADAAKTRMVVENLLDNAIRCSPQGSDVEIEIEAREGDFEVRLLDRGPGIPPEDRERIFQRHCRASPEESPLGNMGLGLSIAWEVMKKHGRTLTVDGRPGGGSIFRFTL